jgi:hypothetical protein
VNYARWQPTVDDWKARTRYELVPLKRLVSLVQYGDSSRSVEEDTGTPVLRMSNLQDGDWDLSELKYTTLDGEARRPYLLREGDILFNRTNSKELVGKCAVFRETGPWAFAGYLIRVRLSNSDAMSPDFTARFLNSGVGRVQIDQVSRQIIGMANINAEELGGLLIPKPPEEVQAQMVADLGAHWENYQERLAHVRELLSRGDREIAARLRLRVPVPERGRFWGARRATQRNEDRLNAEFFNPERMLAVATIEGGPTPARRLDEAAEFVRDQVAAPPAGVRYIGLANIERGTGELVRGLEEESPEGACVRFKPGDVLFAKLRPYLNKVHLAEESGVCSPEFLVLRAAEGIRPEYLAAILRSEVTVAQTRHMAGGNTHPRLTATDVHAMRIPVPRESKVQDEIADAEAAHRASARALKAQAEQDWKGAKQRFGDDLLG